MQHSLKKLTRPEPFYRQVQARIKEYILENKLQPGDALPPETDLARQLGVGRNAVREASKALEALGMLEVRHGSGLFVRGFSFDTLFETMPYGILVDLQELSDLLQVRRVLETGLIENVIQTISDEQIAGLQKITEQMRERLERGENFTEEDKQFHQQLFTSLQNNVLLKLLDVFWLTFDKASQSANLKNIDPQKTYREHVLIFEAVRDKDVERAREALVQHYAGLEGKLKHLR